jgi:hypothetical protein
MTVRVDVQVRTDEVRFHCPEAGIEIAYPNIVAYDVRTKKILAVGLPKEQIQEESPEQWNERQDNIRFTRPFDIQRFDVELAVAVLDYYTRLIISMARDNNPRLRDFHRFEYHFDIDGFQCLPQDIRAQFETHLLYQLGHCKATIQGQLRKGWQYKAAAWVMRSASILGFACFVIVALWLVPREAIYTSLPEWGSSILGLTVLIAGYIGSVCGSIVCILTAKRTFPIAFIRSIVPPVLPKSVVHWLLGVPETG